MPEVLDTGEDGLVICRRCSGRYSCRFPATAITVYLHVERRGGKLRKKKPITICARCWKDGHWTPIS